MNDIEAKRIYKFLENDKLFLDKLKEVSEKSGWEPGHLLRACIALGWEQITKNEKESTDDKTELE